MNSFLELHRLSISGTINTFDRVIFKGHLNGFFPDGAFGRYLSRRGILLKDAGRFFEAETQRIRDHVVSLAEAAGRPVEYLAHASTHHSGTSKEARAHAPAFRGVGPAAPAEPPKAAPVAALPALAVAVPPAPPLLVPPPPPEPP